MLGLKMANLKGENRGRIHTKTT